jgi:homoserine O-acetyltransferase
MRCWLHRGALALRAHAPFIRARGQARAMNAAAALNANALVDEYGDMSGNSGETHILSDLKLECGQVLHQVPCRYKTWGALNEEKDNVILVAHAFTGSHELDSWWRPMLGPGKALDTDKFLVVCMNTLGSCYGTCGPTSVDTTSGDNAPYGPAFPTNVSIRDAVRLQTMVLHEALGVEEVACAVGGSMGGMIALEMCYRQTLAGTRSLPPLARSAVLLSTNGRHSAWQIAMSELQRRAIEADPLFKGGRYARGAGPVSGLELARAIAMVSYRTHNKYATTFGRLVRDEDGSDSHEDFFDEESQFEVTAPARRPPPSLSTRSSPGVGVAPLTSHAPPLRSRITWTTRARSLCATATLMPTLTSRS